MAAQQNQIDVEDLRRRFGCEQLARRTAGGRDADGNIVAPRPAVTLRAVRGVPPPPLTPAAMVEKATYGSLSNRNLFNNVFAIEPVFKQFVISGCNTGVFAGQPSHVNCVKMIQLICMARLRLRNALTGQAVARQALYQAMAMGEAMGPFIPDDWKMNQEDSQAEIVRAARWLISEDGMASINLAPEDWFDHKLLGLDENIYKKKRKSSTSGIQHGHAE